MRFRSVMKLTLILGATFLIAMIGALLGGENLRGGESRLHDDGYYFGEIDGTFNTALAAALTRYQIRNGLPITGQLDVDTSKALSAKPAVTTPAAADSAQTSETWRRLRKRDEPVAAKR